MTPKCIERERENQKENKIVVEDNSIYTLRKTALDRGFIIIPKEYREKLLPKGHKSIKIYDENEKMLTYDPIKGRLYGFTQWFRDNNAEIGDKVEIQSFGSKKRFSFKLIKERVNQQILISQKTINVNIFNFTIFRINVTILNISITIAIYYFLPFID